MQNSPFGKMIQTKRLSLGLTQEELAFRIGTTPRSIGRWERTAKLPGVHNLIALRRELSLNVSEIEELIQQNNAFGQLEPPAEYSVHDFNWCIKTGLGFEKLSTRLNELNDETYTTYPAFSSESKIRWLEIHQLLPDCGRLLVKRNVGIVGYWHFVPIQKDLVTHFKNGDFDDSMVHPQSINLLSAPGVYEIYFLDLTILPEHRNFKTRSLMLQSFIGNLLDLAEYGIFIECIYAVVISKEAELVAQSLGFEYHCNHAFYKMDAGSDKSAPAMNYYLPLIPYHKQAKIFSFSSDLRKIYSKQEFY